MVDNLGDECYIRSMLLQRIVGHRGQKRRTEWNYANGEQYRYSDGNERITGRERSYSESLEHPELDFGTNEDIPTVCDSRVLTTLNRLPWELKLVYSLYYRSELPQRDIAKILNMHQAAVSHRIKSIQSRLKTINDKPKPPAMASLVRWLGEPTAEVCWAQMEVYANQSKVADVMTEQRGGQPLSQVQVRYVLRRAVRDLETLSYHSERPLKDRQDIRCCLRWAGYWEAVNGVYGLMYNAMRGKHYGQTT